MQSLGSPSLKYGLALLEQGRFPEAERYLRDALAGDPNNASALQGLALCELQDSRRRDDALTTINRAIGVDPGSAHIHATKAHILSRLNRPREALLAADEAISWDPSDEWVWSAKAEAHLGLRDWVQAEAAARRALEIDPEDTGAANLLAHALRLQNRQIESRDEITNLLARDPQNAFSHATAGWSSLQAGDRQAAQRHFLEALRIDPELESARSGLLETFKARSAIYRLYLAYCFWMERMSGPSQILILIGLVVGVKLFRAVLSGPWAWVAGLVTALYILFAFWVHVAPGVGNFLLLTDRFARHALRCHERRLGLAVGGCLVAGLALCAVVALTGRLGLLPAGLGFIGASIPFAHTFGNGSAAGRWLFGIFGSITAGFACLALATFALSGQTPVWVSALGALATLLVVATTWLANVPALRTSAD